MKAPLRLSRQPSLKEADRNRLEAKLRSYSTVSETTPPSASSISQIPVSPTCGASRLNRSAVEDGSSSIGPRRKKATSSWTFGPEHKSLWSYTFCQQVIAPGARWSMTSGQRGDAISAPSPTHTLGLATVQERRRRCPKNSAMRSASGTMTKAKMAPRSTRMKTAKVMKNTRASDWSRNERFPAAVSRPIPVARTGLRSAQPAAPHTCVTPRHCLRRRRRRRSHALAP
jgi:hypothetical protein